MVRLANAIDTGLPIISCCICLTFFVVDGDYCLTCGSDKSIKLWNPYRGVLLKTYSGHGYEVLDAQSSCDSRYHSINSKICIINFYILILHF